MKIIYNKVIPVPGYVAMTVCKWIFARIEHKELMPETVNHECIHMAEEDDFIIPILKYVIFYTWYLLEWLIKLPTALFGYNPYYSISFEQESYANQSNLDYLKTRKKFNWLKYVFKLVK